MKISPEFYMGAHWQMADQSIAIIRRMRNKARQSERQKALGMGTFNFAVLFNRLTHATMGEHFKEDRIDSLNEIWGYA